MGWLGGGAETPGPTAQETALARNAAVRFNDQQARFVPLEDSFIASLTASDGERATQRGAVTTDVAQAMTGGDQSVVRQSGGQAGQGKSIMARAGLATQGGIARGEAAAGADAAIRSREIAGLTKMSSFGRGLQDMNSVTLRSAAQNASQSAISKLNAKVTDRGTMMDGIGTFAGTAIGNVGSMSAMKDEWNKKYGG